MTSTTSISDLVLAALITYGPLALGLALLLGGAGLPIPGSVVLLAAGAFAKQGFINWQTALLFGLVGVVIGDSIAYAIGRTGGAWAERRLSRLGAWQTATQQFARQGAWAVFLTRFLITPLGVPVSLTAGVSDYPYRRFLPVDAAGEVLWVLGYGAIGYALGTQWQAATQLISNFSGLILGVALLVVGGVLVWRMLRRRTPQGAVQGAVQVAGAEIEAAPQPGD